MFQLHERLAADTHNLGRSQLCEILLMNDRTWPWIILVPAVPDIGRSTSSTKSSRNGCWKNRRP